MKLIDTDIAIDHFHGNFAAGDFFAEAIAGGEMLAISIVTLTELLAGQRPGEETRTEKLLGLFTILDINEAIGRKAGEYLRQFSRTHHLELGDALIAATAATAKADLATRNHKHYPMTDITIFSPYERGKK
jgi:predicted nucleic acid-binding protein